MSIVDEFESKYHTYCFKNENGAVFLNRWDERIKEFKTYRDAITYAKDNFDLINRKINE